VASSLCRVKSILGPTLERDSDLLATVTRWLQPPQITNAELQPYVKNSTSPSATRELRFTYVENVGRPKLQEFEADSCARSSLGVTVADRQCEGLAQRPIRLRLTRLVAVEILGEGILKNVLLAWISPISRRTSTSAPRPS